MDENVSYLDLPKSFKVNQKTSTLDAETGEEEESLKEIKRELIDHAVSVEEIKEVLSQQYAVRDTLKNLYYSSKRVKVERTKQIQQKRFKLKLCTSEQRFISDQNGNNTILKSPRL
ncbi:hypothetical protein CU097_012943 [Rhizopus azygosporus]|uniref:Uncharacterized protein n=1 Tax=Rhizopus azygosporus TaxID=86630 RepID=A0A367JT32_RHIAZ|nr:hypothetical protein CU097_012943 [Rhizopus azygosporus]